jgi:hypothetical protein
MCESHPMVFKTVICTDSAGGHKDGGGRGRHGDGGTRTDSSWCVRGDAVPGDVSTTTETLFVAEQQGCSRAV